MASILLHNPNPYVCDIVYTKLYDLYEMQCEQIWFAKEINYCDKIDCLNAEELAFIRCVLSFFSASDGIVMENLIANFQSGFSIVEARSFFSAQNFIEGIHSETYARLLMLYCPEDYRQRFQSMDTDPFIKSKKDWCMKYMVAVPHDADDTVRLRHLGRSLVAWACVEGIFFCSSFCSIFWLRQRRDMDLEGLFMSNELISKDETLHCLFGCTLYKTFPELQMPRGDLEAIVKSAVAAEQRWVESILPFDLQGMNKSLMKEYVESVADNLLQLLGHQPLWGTPNPFPFMERLRFSGKTNFFEKHNSDYTKITETHAFSMDEDF